MAKLENNNENRNKKSIGKNIESSMKKQVDNVKEGVKGAAELAQDAINHPVKTAEAYVDQVSKDVASRKWWATLLLTIFWVSFIIITSFLIIINLPVTKNYIAQKVISQLNKDLKSQIAFERAEVNFFGDVTIHQLSAKDYKGYQFLKAKQLYAASDWFSIISDSRNLRFQSMALDNLDLKVITYKGDSISNFIRFIDLFDNGKPSTNKTPFQLRTRIYVRNSKASIVNQNSPGEAGKWLDATNLNLVLPELYVRGSEIYAQINNLSFDTNRYGKKHRVETFTTNLSLNKKYLQLSDLTINTDHTLLQGGLKFNLNKGKWSDFANKVIWELDVHRGSQISGYDISYFVPHWDNHSAINISGDMSGSLNNFKLEQFKLGNPNVNLLAKNASIKDILDGDFKIESSALSTDFTYKDLKAMLPSFISKKMKNFADDFGRLKYNGTAMVTPDKIFVSTGDLVTGIGQAKIKNFSLTDFSTDTPRYNGFVDVKNLNTSIITKSKEVGLISGRFQLKGESFDVNKMKIETNSHIAEIEILNKKFHNINLKGLLNRRQYTGFASIDAPHAKASVDGLIDFRTKRIVADIKANIAKLDINYFTGDATPQVFSGNIRGKIAMSNVNDMTVDVEVQQIAFGNGKTIYNIPNGHLKTAFEGSNRFIAVDMPGAVIGKINGKYNLEDLPGMLQNSFNRILVSPAPKKWYKNQSFTMDFKVDKGILGYFVPDLSLSHGAKIDGAYHGNTNNLVLNVDAEGLLYLMANKEVQDDKTIKYSKDSLLLNHLVVRINTSNLAEQFFVRADQLSFAKNRFRDITISGRNPEGNLLHLASNFKYVTKNEAGTEVEKEYLVNLNQTSNAVGDLVVRFEPTQVNVNNVLWSVDTDPALNHSIVYRKKTSDFEINNLKIVSDDSSVFLKNAVFKSGEQFSATGELNNFQIGKVVEMLSGKNGNEISGLASGAFSIQKNKEIIKPIIALNVQDILMNKQDLGNFNLEIKDSSNPNIFEVNGRLTSAGILGNNKLQIGGTINYNTPSPTLDVKSKLDDFDIGFAQQFVGSVFSKMRGKATGDLNISGPLDDIDYNGDIALKGVGLKLDFTGVDYSFDDTTVSISKGLAFLNDIGVHDERKNSRGSISGLIRFETISSMAMNLVMRAENLMVLNTTQQDFDLFWGKVYGQGTLNISGPVSGLSLESDPQDPMRSLNNSMFTFNSSSTSGVDEFKMLRFVRAEQDGKIVVEEKKRSGANINVDLIAAVDKGTTVNVLMGGDLANISVKGFSERLRFKMSPAGKIEMIGNYSVDNGTFVSKAVLERTFQIAKGSSIHWDGDAMSPDLTIKATYLRTVSNTGQYLQMNNLPPINVQLTTSITGKLNNPVIEFGIEAPDASSQLKEALAVKMANKDDRIMQFGSILVLNSFNTSNIGGVADMKLGNAVGSTGYNILFKQLGSVLSAISNEVQVDLDYISGDAASNTGDRANANLKFALSPRWTFKTGFGIPITKSDNASSQYLSGQGIVEYDYSKNNDGSRLIRMYSKPSNIGLLPGVGSSSANQSYGVGAVYSKSFNTLFKKREKNKNHKSNAMNNKIDSAQNVDKK